MACLIETETVGTAKGGTWEREARRAALLAGELGLTLDEDVLLLADVRELMALCRRLQAAQGRPRWRRHIKQRRFGPVRQPSLRRDGAGFCSAVRGKWPGARNDVVPRSS